MGEIIQLQQKKARYWNPKVYMAYPQEPYAERLDGSIPLMSVDDIVELALEGDVNSLEWLGHDIDTLLPMAMPLPLETEAECSCCGKVKPLTDFYKNPQKRNGRRSECKTCHIEHMKLQYHHGKLRKWGRAA